MILGTTINRVTSRALVFVAGLIMLHSPPGFGKGTNQLVTLREGDGLRVATIRFFHLKHKPIPNEQLRAAMVTTIGEPLQRRFFRNDLETIENLYRGKGHMDISIRDRRLTTDGKGNVHIAIDIHSGKKWKVAAVELVAADSVALPKLPKKRKLRPGKTFKYARMLQDERRLQSALNQQGYANADVNAQLELNSKDRTATVRYQVDPGRRYYFGPVTVKGVKGNQSRSLLTRSGLIDRALTFREGDLFDPAELSLCRSNLARTNLFRSVIMNTSTGAEDSLQHVEILLEEMKYLHLGGQFTMENTDARLAGNIQHRNWLGRGGHIGLDGSLGQPKQGATAYVSERHILGSGADLTVSVGLSDEWGRTKVGVAAEGEDQQNLLRDVNPLFQRLLDDSETETANRYLRASFYQFRSIERIWNTSAVLQRSWAQSQGLTHLLRLSLRWTRARTKPTGGNIDFKSSDHARRAAAAALGDPNLVAELAADKIKVDSVWEKVLTDESHTIDLNLSFERDTRNNQISPSSGTYLKIGGLAALQMGDQATRVLDGVFEFRYYQPLGSHFVLAQGLSFVQAASLREDRTLPQTYWKEYGGEGSVRGVPRQSIQAVGGGRTGANLRTELRFERHNLGVVSFWDRASVWRHTSDAQWSDMTDGYGVGLRYIIGFPLRFDLGTDDGFSDKRYYFSIGQAF